MYNINNNNNNNNNNDNNNYIRIANRAKVRGNTKAATATKNRTEQKRTEQNSKVR
jgi:hypothetical protein